MIIIIKTEFYRVREDGIILYRTYSDLQLMIQKKNTNEIYEEVIESEDNMYNYIETSILIQEWDSILEWDQNRLYSEGEKVYFNNKIWQSEIDNNSYRPGEQNWLMIL